MDLVSSVVGRVKAVARNFGKKVSDDEGLIRRGRPAPVQAVQDYFNPLQERNFWKTPIAEQVVGFQRALEQKKLPMLNLTQYAQGINEPVPRIAAELGLGFVENMANIPQRILHAGGRAGLDLRDMLEGKSVGPGRKIGTAAEAALPFADILTLGGGTVAKGIGEQALKRVVRSGPQEIVKRAAISGGLLGAGYGALGGAAEGESVDLGNVLKGSLTGGIIGGAAGGVAGGIGGLMGLVRRPPHIEKELLSKAMVQPRDPKTGRWTYEKLTKPKGMSKAQWEHQLKFNKRYGRNPYMPVFASDLRKAAEYELRRKQLGLSIRDINKDVSPFDSSVKSVKDETTKLVSRAVKEGKITLEEGQAILSDMLKGKTTPLPPKIPVRESGGEVGRIKIKGLTGPQTTIPKTTMQIEDILRKERGGFLPQEDILTPKTTLETGLQKQTEQLTGQGGKGGVGGPPAGEKGFASFDEMISNIKSKVNKIYTQTIDRFHPISEVGKMAGEEKKIRNALTGYYGAGSTATYHVDFELTPILKEQNIDDLRRAAIAMRDVELARRGIKGSPQQKKAVETLQNLTNELGEDKMGSLGETLQKLYKYQDNIVKKYLVDTGIISEASYNKMRQNNQFYVPFKRVMDQVDDFLGFTPPTKGAGSVSSQNVIFKIKGSDKELVDPIESILESTYKIVGLGKRQEVARTIVSLKDKLPEGMIKKISGNIGKTPNISVFENSKVKHYAVPQELADAAKGLSEEALNTLIKILQVPTQYFRATATGINPEFMLPNIARDLQSAFVNAGLNPLRFARGIAHMMGKDEIYQEFLKSGGKTSRISIDRPMLTKTVSEISGKRGIEILKPSKILDILQKLGEYSEQPTRIAVFESKFLDGLKKGLSREEAAKEAAYWAQEATVNFARRGSKTQSINAIYAFLNARAQGVDRLIRSLKNDPKGTTFRLGIASQLPAIGLYVWNRNFDSYYDERVVTKNDKENNFIIMLSDVPIKELGGAQFIKIPKGDIGKIANPTEAFLSFVENKGGTIKQSLISTLKAFSPFDNIGDFIPTALRPPIEVGANKSFFFNTPIVPEYKKDYPAKYQYSSYTAPLYRMIGEKLGVSPAKIQAIVEGYGTGIAKIGEMTTRPFIPEEYKSKKLEEGQPINRTPILRRFLGGEKRTIEEQELTGKKRIESINYSIRDILSGIKRGEIPQEEGLKKIEELKQKQGEILNKQTSNIPSKYLYINKEDGIKTLDLSKITPSGTDTNYQKAIKLKKAFSYVDDILDSSMSIDEKGQALAKLGIDPEDAAYYNVARQNNTIKDVYVRDEIAKYGDNRQEMLLGLLKLRREVNGKLVLADGVIDSLYEDGIISYDERKWLKNAKYTKEGEIKVKLSGRGKRAKLKSIRIQTEKLSYKTPKLKAVKIGGIRKSGKQAGRGRIFKARRVSYR